MYGISILQLIRLALFESVAQKWNADDGNAVGSHEKLKLKKLLINFKLHDSDFGYHVVVCKLSTKRNFFEKAKKLFDNLDIEIDEGHRVLGSIIGSENSQNSFIGKTGEKQFKTMKT